jgi:hypothetical protein
MQVTSREYKVIVDSSWLIDVGSEKAGDLKNILDDAKELAHALNPAFGVLVEGGFDPTKPKQRIIRFLDTSDFTLQQNGLLLRQRVEQDGTGTDYTLKCRTEDRYVAAGQDFPAADGLKTKSKLEEDIGCPFVSRFSRSITVSLDSGHELAGDSLPATLSAAAQLFPGLVTVQHDGLPCAPATALAVVGRTVLERVFEGPTLRLAPTHGTPTTATIALILWSKTTEGRTLTAEFSFRYKDDNEGFSPEVASAARRYFEGVQRLDWARPDATTKTQYMYGRT